MSNWKNSVSNFLPQMAPIWWLTLMMMFILMIMISMNFMYFNYIMKIDQNNKFNFNKMNWTW